MDLFLLFLLAGIVCTTISENTIRMFRLKEFQTTIGNNKIRMFRLKEFEKEGVLCQNFSKKCEPCLCLKDEEYYCDCRNLKPETDCLQYHKSGVKVDGIYRIKLNNQYVNVYCDQNTDGGGWTVIQRRVDDSTNFYRNWTEYAIGFGKKTHNFWFGNRNIHLLTTESRNVKGTELRVDMISRYTGEKKYAKYNRFKIGNEDWYDFMITISGYSGNAGDSLTEHNQQRFSTFDRDHDKLPYFNCARAYHGAWWYRKCYFSNLNGAYDALSKLDVSKRINWNSLGFWDYMWTLSFVEMKIRPLV